VTFADGAASSGNVLAYQVAPDLTFTASDQSRTYATGLNNSLITLEILEGESTADQADYDFVLGGITTQLGFGSGVTFSTADAANVGTYEGGVAVSATLDEGAATGMNITTVDGELTINPLSLFIESVGPFDKVYDGTTDASTSMFEFAEGSGLVRNDVVNFSITGDYGDKNVGSEKTVTDISVALSGMDAGNYEAFTLSESEGEIEGIGSISARALALNVGVDDKVYDGGTVAAVNFSDDRVTGDALTFSASGAFEDKDVGTNKTVLVGEITVGGADAGNYAIDTTLDTTADISRRVLSLELTAEDRAYDGTTIAKVSTTDDRIEGDVLSFGGSPVFEDKNVGEDKFVTLEGASLSGVDAANYQLSDDIGTTAAITARGLSVTGSPDDKVYDGTDTVDVSFSDDRVEGDVLTVVASASFADKNVGTDKEIEVFGISISGTDAGNYVVEGSAGGTADITARDLNVTAGAADKEYDGTTVADITFADDGIEGDTLSLSGTAVFDTKSAGLGKSVSISDVALIGDDASNYTLVVNDAASADISRLTLSLETIASDKIYDGNTVAEVSFEATPLEGDDVTVNGTGAFDDKNVGDEKTVTVSDGILSGDDAENYTLGEDITDVASITPRALNIFVEVADKAYDGTTDASVSLDDDRVAGDVLTVTGIAAFDDKNVGVDKPVNIFEFDVSGADVGNYEASIETVEVATITPRELTLMVDAEDKIYDGTTDAIANIFVDEIEGDAVTAVGIGKFDTKNAGTDKTVTVTEVALSGSDAANYSAATSAQGIADIDPRLLSLTVTAQDRIFDGTTDIELDVSDDRVDGDDITVTATGSLADGDPGQDKAVTVTSFAVTGPDAGNYQAIAPNNQTQASIAPAETRESARPQPQINERAPEPVPTPSLVEAGFGVYSDVATDALVRDLNAASEFCRQIGESEYVVDCLGDRLAEIARRLPANGAYAESREALETAAQKLEALVRENASAALPPLRIATRSLSGGGTQNRVLRAIDTANIASVTEQAVAILQEAETVLLRSAESSQRRRVHYQRIATAVGSNKLLLRST